MTSAERYHLVIFDRDALHDECFHLYAEHEQATGTLVGHLWDLYGMDNIYGHTAGDVLAGAEAYLTTILALGRNMGLIVTPANMLAHLLMGDNRPVFFMGEGEFADIANLLMRMWLLRESERLRNQMLDLYALGAARFGIQNRDDLERVWSDTWDYLSGGRHPGEVEAWP